MRNAMEELSEARCVVQKVVRWAAERKCACKLGQGMTHQHGFWHLPIHAESFWMFVIECLTSSVILGKFLQISSDGSCNAPVSMAKNKTPIDQISLDLPSYSSPVRTSGATHSGVPQAVLQIESAFSSLLNLHHTRLALPCHMRLASLLYHKVNKQ